jgi:hypothetical protein
MPRSLRAEVELSYKPTGLEWLLDAPIDTIIDRPEKRRCNVSMIPARRARERQAGGLHKTLADAQDVCTRTPRELSCDAKGATT